MRAIGLLPLAVCLAGCAAHADLAQGIREALVRDNPDRALALLDRRPDPRSVLWQMERGFLLRAVGRLDESNRAFSAAQERREELYTRSVSNEATALALSDLVRPYRPAEFETPFLRVYPILNYLELGDLEGAVVEARALSQELEARRDRADGSPGDWGPGRLLAGLVFEAAGEWNDAGVAYRAADSAWAGRDAGPAAEMRAWLAASMIRVSSSGLAPGEIGPAKARTVVWIEEGLVPPKEELRLRLPILREEESWTHDQLGAWGDRLGRRATELQSGAVSWTSEEVLDWIEVALPFYPDPPPVTPPLPRVSVEGAAPKGAMPLEDLAASARDDLARAFPGIAARAAVRLLLKQFAAREAAAHSGEWGGRVAGWLGVLTERADTRGWSTLPARVSIAVLDVDPGRVNVEVLGASGTTCIGEFAIEPGGWHFLSCRSE